MTLVQYNERRSAGESDLNVTLVPELSEFSGWNGASGEIFPPDVAQKGENQTEGMMCCGGV